MKYCLFKFEIIVAFHFILETTKATKIDKILKKSPNLMNLNH